MTSIVYLLIICAAVCIDARKLRDTAPDIYTHTLRRGPLVWVILMFIFGIFTGPIYYLRRRNYIRELEEFPKDDIEADPNFYLYIEAGSVLLLWYIIQTFLFLAVSLFMKSGFIDTFMIFSVFSILSNVIFIACVYYFTRIYRIEDFYQVVGIHATKHCFYRYIAGASALGGILAAFNTVLLYGREEVLDTPLAQSVSQADGISILVFLFTAIFLAPIMEEIIYRGYIYSVLDRLKGKAAAFILVSFLFALNHVEQLWGDWTGIYFIGILAVTLTALRHYSGSVIPGMVTHFIYNTAVIIVPIVMIFMASPPYFKYSMSFDKPFEVKEQLLNESIEKYPDFPHAYNDLAWLYTEENKELDRALTLVEKALEMDPENPAYLDTKAEVLYTLDRYPEALLIEKGLVDQYPDKPFYREQLEKIKAALTQPQAS